MPAIDPGADEGARRRRTAAATRATLANTIHGDETTALDDLLLFDRFDRWTAPLFARHRRHSAATARKRLQVLVGAGVVVCAQGAVSGTGGSEPDLYVLASHGALVLDHVNARPRNATKAPPLSLGAALPTAGGRRKLKGVVGGTTPHVLNCLELALHHDWLDDEGWQIMRQLAYRDEDGEIGHVYPRLRPARRRSTLGGRGRGHAAPGAHQREAPPLRGAVQATCTGRAAAPPRCT